VATRAKRPSKQRSVQAPKRRADRRSGLPRWWPWAGVGAAVAIGAVAVALVASGGGGDEAAGEQAGGLPNTPDYHSLLVAADDPRTVVLGTHNGLYRSADGGLSWQQTALEGQDAMNLGRAGRDVTWTAGHNVLAKSADGGRTWQDVRPDGLPHLDIHGFAVDPRDPGTLWAALAGQGLYRSTDSGKRFALVTRDVGAGVMALAVTPGGRVLAGDMQQGLLISDDGGKRWQRTLEAGLMGLAVNPKDPELILATGPGILRSSDGGGSWDQVLPLEQGAGPVAWAPSEPNTAYVVGFDRALYKTTDGGERWQPVTGGGS